MSHQHADLPADRAVTVAVLNQPVPLVRTRADSRRSFVHAADLVLEIGHSRQVNLLVLPAFGIQGASTDPHEPQAFPDEALELLGHACRAVGVWAAVSMSGDPLRSARPHQVALLDGRGRVVARHATGSSAAPDGPRVVSGPGGLSTALTFADDVRRPLVDPGVWGAELVIQYWATPGTRSHQVVESARGLAWSNTCFVASANAAGSDGLNRWSGHSSLVNHDGSLLGMCHGEAYELRFAEFDVADIRRTRRVRARSGRAVAESFRRCSSPRAASISRAQTT